MGDALFLAIAYIRFHRLRSAVLVLALALILVVPVLTRAVLTSAEGQLSARADETGLLIGAKGSALDLIMNGLYFTSDRPSLVSMATHDRVWDSGLAEAIPLHVLYRAGGAPVVGTSVDYFDFRNLFLQDGRRFAVLGEAVLGANAAKSIGVTTGKTLLTDPENLFDLAGSYPLELSVVGILEASGTADDDAVFVDLKTAWVVQGLGHGHDDVVVGTAPDAATTAVTANAALQQFTRITPENIDSFHFHGDPDSYPLSSVIAIAPDAKRAAILRGRYLGEVETEQIVVPPVVISSLLATIFRIGEILDAVFVVVAFAALIAVGLAFYLSAKLRAGEMLTAFRLGCHRMTQWRLMGAELVLLAITAMCLAGLCVAGLTPYVSDIAVWLVTNKG